VREEAPHSGVYAALDLGTNNCRLLLAYPQFRESRGGKTLRAVDSFSRIVRLGEGVSSSGMLSEDAMERTLTALHACKRKMDQHSVVRGRYVATEACRRARNALMFVERVRKETGLCVEIISGEEEARLALLGCCSLLKRRTAHALAFDIGGGSTELMWVEARYLGEQAAHGEEARVVPFDLTIKDWISVPCGVMNLSEQFGGSGYAELYFEDIVARVEEHLRAFDARHDIARFVREEEVQLLSTSGTVTTLAAVHLDLPRYDRSRVDGINLPIAAIDASIARLLAMRPYERFNHPCIGADRSDYILSGCAIFRAIQRVWPFARITIADRGVREGIIISLLLERSGA
jgi:exopolyphosphatase/guanosine-5'-triphosphate,3'-diphosphate pyrophosphatase